MSEREFGRRAVLELLGGIALLAACSDSDSTSRPTGLSTPRSSPGTSGRPRGTTFDAARITLPPAQRLTNAQLGRTRERINGNWLGSWRDDRGRSGHVDGVVDVHVAARRIDMTLTITGGFLGSTAPIVTTSRLTADALSRALDDVTLQSPVLGPYVLQFPGFGQFRLTSTQVPGHPSITSLDVKGVGEGTQRGAMTYAIEGADSAAGKGTVVGSRDGTRPEAPAPGSASDMTGFVHGDYAAGLITHAEAERITGVPMRVPESNGGRPVYEPGIAVSNGRVESVADIASPGYVAIQFSVYRAQSAGALETWFARYGSYRTIAGLGTEARALPPDAQFPITSLAVRNRREGLEINIVHGGSQPLPKERSNAMVLAAARTIVGRMQ